MRKRLLPPGKRYFSASPRRRTVRKAKIRLMALLLAAAGLFLLLGKRLSPMAGAAAAQQAGEIAVETVDRAVRGVLEQEGAGEEYLSVVREETGEIRFLAADPGKINRLKTKLSGQIRRELQQIGRRSVSVPAGTLLGNSLLWGLGPPVTLHFTVKANAFCEILSRFDGAGINQTRHSLRLSVRLQVFAMLPGGGQQTEAETEFLLSETVVMGRVPALVRNSQH